MAAIEGGVKSLSMKKCEWKIKGLYPVSADDAVDVINGCQDESGYISAKAVVDASRSERAILHPCFEWNDGTAAEKWREQQARVMIKNLVVVEVKDDRRCEVKGTLYYIFKFRRSEEVYTAAGNRWGTVASGMEVACQTAMMGDNHPDWKGINYVKRSSDGKWIKVTGDGYDYGFVDVGLNQGSTPSTISMYGTW